MIGEGYRVEAGIVGAAYHIDRRTFAIRGCGMNVEINARHAYPAWRWYPVSGLVRAGCDV